MIMKLLRLALGRQTAIPVMALGFASVTAVLLVTARVIWTRDVIYASLIWNLFLAWLPLAFALLVREEFGPAKPRRWRFWGLAVGWLLFFPNAPYIFTDLVHLTTYFYRHFWIDLVLILLCALTGLVLGFLSLYLVQGLVRRLYGMVISWFFVLGVAGLSGFGIYLGRFLRFNSWDVIWKPVALTKGITSWAANPMAHSASYAFPFLFALFLFVSYLMLYALTHLHPEHLSPLSANREAAV